MAFNYDFDLEDDDFYDATFLSISENNSLTSTAVSKIVSSDQKSQPPKENLQHDILPPQVASSSSPVCTVNENGKRKLGNTESRREDTKLSNLSPIQDSNQDNLVLNSRFTPGFTPKPKKRKFLGPAGINSQDELESLSTCNFKKSSTEKPEDDAEVLDFYDATFLSISENNSITSTAVSKIVSSDQKSQHSNKNLQHDILPQQIASASSPVCTVNENGKRTLESTESRREDAEVSNLSPIQDSNQDNLVLNNRFTPGFTPKPKKRRFPGPAGIYSQDELESLSTCYFKSSTEDDAEVLGIPSSQLSTDELLLPSWQNLQKDVSSCPTFLSTAKYYSIHRVLNETSKKKLPKHLEVPVLCVLIKKFEMKDSSLMFMDDTDEIPGKIDNIDLDTYREYLKAGTALILRKVTCMFNVLWLQEKSFVSIYLGDGSVKHIHELNSILDKEEPLKPMSCECLGTPKANERGVAAILKMCDVSPNAVKPTTSSNLLNSEMSCKTPCTNSNFSKQRHVNYSNPNNLSPSLTLPNAPHFSKASKTTTPIGNSSNVGPPMKNNISSNLFAKSTDKVPHINVSHIASKASGTSLPSNENELNSVEPIPMNSTETDDLFCGGSGLEEFDELLSSLDEKSFLG